MPPRSTTFQEVVAIIKQHMAEDASVEESVELVDRLTDAPREVDVVIRTTVAGYPIIVGIEVRERGRRGTVEWVEQEHSKHSRLDTNRLVLISTSGFTKGAKELAEKYGIITVTPTLEGREKDDLAKSIDALIAKVAVLQIEGGAAIVDATDESPEERGNLSPDLLFYDSKGEVLGTAHQISEAIVRAANFSQHLLELSPEVTKFHVFAPDFDYRVEGSAERRHMYMQNLGPPPHLKRISTLLIAGSIKLEEAEFSLRHGSLEGTDFAYGQAKLGQTPALIVMTGSVEAGGHITLRSAAIDHLDLRQGNDLGIAFD
jgi:hypothetical protein